MVYIKSILAGIVAVIGSAVLIVALTSAALYFGVGPWRREGSGGIGAVSFGVTAPLVLLVAALIFSAGFLWEFRRASH